MLGVLDVQRFEQKRAVRMVVIFVTALLLGGLNILPIGDYSWLKNLQSTPLYRCDLDIVAATPQSEIAAFCTISFDDYTRSPVTVLVGTAAEHWQRRLGKAVKLEGMHR